MTDERLHPPSYRIVRPTDPINSKIEEIRKEVVESDYLGISHVMKIIDTYGMSG